MEELTIEQCIERLKHVDAFKTLVGYLQSDFDGAVRELTECPIEQQDRKVGEIAAYQHILDQMRG